MVVFQTRLMQKVWVHFVRDLVWCIADFNTSMSHAVKHWTEQVVPETLDE